MKNCSTMLKELRQKESKKKGLPPFVLFLENSIQDMATLYPTTLEELEKCQGVSKGKAIRYGKAFHRADIANMWKKMKLRSPMIL